jgi:DNA-binding NtrC family response regulator
MRSMMDRPVLVVEDEPILRMMALDLVEDAGFDDVEACSADHAIEILAARTDIRIVFSDIDMPGTMDGLNLALAIRDRWPTIEIILTSGHRRVDVDSMPARAVFFPKPYDFGEVTATLHRFGSA